MQDPSTVQNQFRLLNVNESTLSLSQHWGLNALVFSKFKSLFYTNCTDKADTAKFHVCLLTFIKCICNAEKHSSLVWKSQNLHSCWNTLWTILDRWIGACPQINVLRLYIPRAQCFEVLKTAQDFTEFGWRHQSRLIKRVWESKTKMWCI